MPSFLTIIGEALRPIFLPFCGRELAHSVGKEAKITSEEHGVLDCMLSGLLS